MLNGLLARPVSRIVAWARGEDAGSSGGSADDIAPEAPGDTLAPDDARVRSDGGGTSLPPSDTARPNTATAGRETRPDAGGQSPIESFPKDFHQILHLTKAPMFVTDAAGDALVWNEGMRELTGSTEADAKSVEQISSAWYHDGRRAKTLADKIVDTHSGTRAEATPTHTEYDVEKVDWVGFELYQDESTFADADGETRHVRFSAAPLYENDEFVGVVEYVEDRTDDVRRQKDLERLVDEVTTTLTAVESGQLTARADASGLDHVEDELTDVIGMLNRTLRELEETVDGITEDSEQLRSSTHAIADRTDSITDAADQQESSLQEVSGEVNNVSASIEEIASTADSVSSNATQAVEEAERGSEAATSAEETMSEVTAATDEVVDDVRELQTHVEDIDEAVDMIDDIAEQTNMLALNASIEAARAGEAGEGFAVVAEEIKQLAGESQEHADKIERMVGSIQANTEQTVDSLERVSEQVHDGQDAVTTVQGSIDEVVSQMDETAAGIKQVATVTDDQAASAEEVASMINEVVEAAEQITADVEDIASQNADHAQLADRIDQNLERLTGQQL